MMLMMAIHEGNALKNAAKTSSLGVSGLADALKIPRSSFYYQLKDKELDGSLKAKALKILDLSYEQVFKDEQVSKGEADIIGEEVGYSETGNYGLEFIPLSNGQLLMGVPHVTEYVYGGYLSGFKDPEFIEEMPKHFIPVSQRHRGRYLSFTMRGESMKDGTERSISPGDIITGREIQKKYWTSTFHTKDFPEFIIHTREEGLVVKQVIEHNTTEGWIKLHSYNSKFKDYTVMLDDCVEIFNVIEVSKKNRNQY